MKCLDFASLADERIVIQDRSLVDTDLGGQATTWGAENTVWAIIYPASGKEINAQAQLQSRVTHKFIIRYLAAYKDTAETGTRRISFDGRIFTVKYSRNLDDDMKRHGKTYQEFLCEENGAEND